MRIVVVFASILLASCTNLQPYRYALPGPSTMDCVPTRGSACGSGITESTAKYDLHFVEFDDQGLQFPEVDEAHRWDFDAAAVPTESCDVTQNDCPFNKAWAYQINNLIKQLNTAAQKGNITLIVFIHGWKHNARTDDGNVEGFRRFLATAASVEDTIARKPSAKPRAPRRVVGVYVGWRGQSIDVPFLENVTFWSRKNAAEHVAEGSSRELFARLRAFKCVHNLGGRPVGDTSCGLAPKDDDNVKIVLIGHSFGGLVLYNSISGSLIESMTHAFDANTGSAPYWRFADLAVLINPAFEATRYAPLERIASHTPNDHYETPMLITVTSTTDRATGVAFPFGRFINTLFEQETGQDEHTANRQTIGHHDQYITHQLELPTDPVQCKGWRPIDNSTPPGQVDAILENDLPIELANSQEFFEHHSEPAEGGRLRLKPDRWVRDFCGGVRLTSMAGDGNSPIWNVRVIGDPQLLPDHSDISEPLFVAFFRQIYMDTLHMQAITQDVAELIAPRR